MSGTSYSSGRCWHVFVLATFLFVDTGINQQRGVDKLEFHQSPPPTHEEVRGGKAVANRVCGKFLTGVFCFSQCPTRQYSHYGHPCGSKIDTAPVPFGCAIWVLNGRLYPSCDQRAIMGRVFIHPTTYKNSRCLVGVRDGRQNEVSLLLLCITVRRCFKSGGTTKVYPRTR